MSPRAPSPAVLFSCAIALGGCDGCPRHAPPVRFHSALDASAETTADASLDDVTAVDHPAETLGPDAGRVVIDQAEIVAPAGEHFGAVLSIDRGGDGLADRALLTRVRADGTVAGLGVWQRSGAGWAPVAVDGAAPPAGNCRDAVLRQTSTRVASVVWRCEPDAPTAADAVLLLLQPEVHVGARAAVLRDPLPDTRYNLTVDGGDLDGDGLDDATFTLGVSHAPGAPEVSARVALVQRGGSFTRDIREPAASLQAAVAAIRRGATRRSALITSIGQYDDLARLRRALCSETGLARFQMGPELGIRCDGDATFVDAAVQKARALITLGEFPGAVAMTHVETQDDLGLVPPARLAGDLRRALTPAHAWVATGGPFAAMSLDALAPGRLGQLTFDLPVEPPAVMVRGTSTGRVDTRTLMFAQGPNGALGDVLAVAGDRRVAGFVETCAGLSLVRCAPNTACGDPLGAGAREVPEGAQLYPMGIAASVGLSQRCLLDARAVSGVPASVARVMGVNRDAMVVAVRQRLYRVALAGGPAAALFSGDPLGVRYNVGGAISTNGRFAALPDVDGLWLRDRGRWHLEAPGGLEGRTAQLSDVIVSDDGRTAAAVLGTQVWLMRPPGLAAPAVAP